MSRVIKFRAIDNNGEWCCGLPTYDLGGDMEMSKPDGYTSYGDIEETLGQFTGLTDKNGVEIYEGDILQFGTGLKMQRGLVIFHNGGFRFDINKPFFASRRHINDTLKIKGAEGRVIGNIHQNPELIK